MKRKSTDISTIINVRKEQLMIKTICVYKRWKIYSIVIDQLEKYGYLWCSGDRLHNFTPNKAPLYLIIHKESDDKYITYNNGFFDSSYDSIGINELLSNKVAI